MRSFLPDSSRCKGVGRGGRRGVLFFSPFLMQMEVARLCASQWWPANRRGAEENTVEAVSVPRAYVVGMQLAVIIRATQLKQLRVSVPFCCSPSVYC